MSSDDRQAVDFQFDGETYVCQFYPAARRAEVRGPTVADWFGSLPVVAAVRDVASLDEALARLRETMRYRCFEFEERHYVVTSFDPSLRRATLWGPLSTAPSAGRSLRPDDWQRLVGEVNDVGSLEEAETKALRMLSSRPPQADD